MIEPVVKPGEVVTLVRGLGSTYQTFTSPEDSTWSPTGVIVQPGETLFVVAVKRCFDREWALVLANRGVGWLPNNSFVMEQT